MRWKDELDHEEKLEGLEERRRIEEATRLWLEEKAITDEEKKDKNMNLQSNIFIKLKINFSYSLLFTKLCTFNREI